MPTMDEDGGSPYSRIKLIPVFCVTLATMYITGRSTFVRTRGM